MCIAAAVSIGYDWYPPRVRNAYWLFRIAGGSLDSLPLLTAGFISLSVGLIGLRRPLPLRLFTVCGIPVILVVAGIYAGFLTTVPEVDQMATGSFDRTVIRTEVIRISVATIVTLGIYTWLAWTAWSRSGITKSDKF
jgi:hypothetical protein